MIGVDTVSGALEIERRGERIRLDQRFLAEATAAGDPSLVHGYAITGHVAQGLTVDRAFVLVGDGIDREWAYVALSRGRDTNRLYLAAQAVEDRAEYAPLTPPDIDPVERLARQLRRSAAQVLAIDSGRPLESDTGVRESRRRLRWLLARRQEPQAARDWRERAEAQHGELPFETEADLDNRAARTKARQAEHQTERMLQRDREVGRSL